MFGFKYVYNEKSKRKYYITSATLESDIGYQKGIDDYNMFDIDLQEEGDGDSIIGDICLIVFNNGELQITKGFLPSYDDVPDKKGNSNDDFQACIPYEDVIIVPAID